MIYFLADIIYARERVTAYPQLSPTLPEVLFIFPNKLQQTHLQLNIPGDVFKK